MTPGLNLLRDCPSDKQHEFEFSLLDKILFDETYTTSLEMTEFEKILEDSNLSKKIIDELACRNKSEDINFSKTFHFIVKVCSLAESHPNYNPDQAILILRVCLERLISQGFQVNGQIEEPSLPFSQTEYKIYEQTKPLHLAAAYGCTVLCAVLVGFKGFLLNRKNFDNTSTCLHEAAMYGRVETIKKLIEIGAVVDAIADHSSIGLNNTPLLVGVAYPEVIEILHQNGANIHAVSLDTFHGSTAFARACKKEKLESLKKLIELGARVNVDESKKLFDETVQKIANDFILPLPQHQKKLSEWITIAVKINNLINILSAIDFMNSPPEYTSPLFLAKTNFELLDDNDVTFFKKQTRELFRLAKEESPPYLISKLQNTIKVIYDHMEEFSKF